MDQKYLSVINSAQYQSSEYFPDNSINFEGTHLMSSFDNKSLKMFLLNTQPHMNVLHLIMANQIVILKVHQFIMTPIMIILSIPHMNQMYHQLTISGKIMQKKLGRIFKNNHNRSTNQRLKKHL